MEKVTDKSCYTRIKEHFLDHEKMSLIDRNGSYSQEEAFQIYCGIMNQIAPFIKRGTLCLIAPFSKKETILIIAAIVSLGGITLVGDPSETRQTFMQIIKDSVEVEAFFGYENDNWFLETKEKKFNLTFDKQKLIAKPYKRARKDIPSFYVLTSGSSGANKIVALSEYSFLNNIARQETNDDNYQGVGYLCLPLNHIFGIGTLMQYFLAGHTCYISDTRAAPFALDIIEKYRCTTIPNVPTFFYMLIAEQEKNRRNISSLKYGVIAGGSYSKEQFCNIEKKLGMTLSSSYGMTEASTGISYTTVESSLDERCLGVGRPIKGVKVVLKDEKSNISSEEGEICFKGYNLMLGYVNKGKITLPIDEDGYFHTGDIGRFDNKGNLYIIGRKKNIIIRGGENISPDLLEQKIMRIEGIDDVCIVGLKNEKYGESPAAFVVSRKYKDPELIASILKNRLKKSELPMKIILDKEMPLLPNGKHNVRLIKQLLEKINE